MSWIDKLTTRKKGQLTEQLAEQYLINQGLTAITRNFHSRFGEIDLVMKEQHTFVFVEVKFRQNNQYGGAISTISSQKQQKLKLCAAFYFQQLRLNEYNTPYRFDVMALTGELRNPQITWLKNAF